MSPVWMIEGGATAPEADSPSQPEKAGRRFAPADANERRLKELAAAIRDHESRGRHHALPARPEDLTLYRRLRQICGER